MNTKKQPQIFHTRIQEMHRPPQGNTNILNSQKLTKTYQSQETQCIQHKPFKYPVYTTLTLHLTQDPDTTDSRPHLSSGHPSTRVKVHLFNDIAFNGETSIILGLLPLQFDVVSSNLLREERTFRAHGFACRRKSLFEGTGFI